MRANQEHLKEEILAKMETNQERMEARTNATQEKMEAKREANNEKFEVLRGPHLPDGYPPSQDSVHSRRNESQDEYTSR
jgi:hypothetical protein